MTQKEILQEYAELKIQEAHIQDRLKELREKATKVVELKGGKFENPLGKFTMRKARATWEYSKALEKKMEKIKVEQLDEQESGKATKIEGSPVLAFTIAKL